MTETKPLPSERNKTVGQILIIIGFLVLLLMFGGMLNRRLVIPGEVFDDIVYWVLVVASLFLIVMGIDRSREKVTN